MADDEKKVNCPGGDAVVPLVDLGGGRELAVKHSADHEWSKLGVICRSDSLPPGAVRLEDNPAVPGTYREVEADDGARSGPARYNSRSFEDGWDRIFGGRRPAKA